MSDKAEFLKENSDNRSVCYRFFSGFFGPVRPQELLDLFPQVELFIDAEKDVAEGREIEEREPCAPVEAGNRLESDYAKLFYGIGENNISLSESCYTSEAGLMCQDAWKGIRQLYRKYDFSVNEEHDQEADTLPVEFAFASLLIDNGAPREDLAQLVDRHLLPVTRHVAKAILSRAQDPALLKVTEAMKKFIEAEHKLLTE